MLTIRPERPADIPAIRRVIAAAMRPAEAGLVEALRSRYAGLISLVAVLEGQIVGHILFSCWKKVNVWNLTMDALEKIRARARLLEESDIKTQRRVIMLDLWLDIDKRQSTTSSRHLEFSGIASIMILKSMAAAFVLVLLSLSCPSSWGRRWSLVSRRSTQVYKEEDIIMDAGCRTPTDP